MTNLLGFLLFSCLIVAGILFAISLYYGLKKYLNFLPYLSAGLFMLFLSSLILISLAAPALSEARIADIGIAAAAFLILSILSYGVYDFVKKGP